MATIGEWYRIGTVTVSQNSATITGSGTLWTTNSLSSGSIFIGPDGVWHEIAAVASETSLTLKNNYTGSTQAGASYAIVPMFANSTNANLAARVSALVNSWQGREDEMMNWLAGVVGGGPNNDGEYPLTDATGTTRLIPCIEQMYANSLVDFETVDGGGF